MTDTSIIHPTSRYPGSPPFEDREIDRQLFFGRADDAESILHSILSHDLFVLYARSGIGKTSVLKAGVMEDLRERDLWPILVRLHDTDQDPLDLVRSALDHVGSDERIEVLGIEDGAPDLWSLLSGLEIWRAEDDVLLLPVLIFDQFEELFTLWDAPRRESFVSQFASVVRRVPPSHEGAIMNGTPAQTPRVKFVLSLREDFLGGLEAFSPQLPQILSNRQRLQPLSRSQAEDAIREPALVTADLDSPRFGYDDATVEMILDFLGESHGDDSGYSSDAEIEAFQLQILCHHIESVVLPAILSEPQDESSNIGSQSALPTVTPADVGGADGLRSILKQTYSREIERVISVRERRKIRRLCEVGLIRGGRRRFVAGDDIHRDYGVTEEQLDRLVDARLVRIEPRAGTAYYELAHDSLIDPLLEYRAEKTRQTQRWSLRLAVIVVIAAVATGLGVLALLDSRSSGEAELPIIRVGETVSDSLDSAVEFDVFRVVVDETEGTAILSVTSDAIAQAEVFRPRAAGDGTNVAAPSGTATAVGTLVFLPEPGSYTVVVRPIEGVTSGRYELELEPAGAIDLSSEDPDVVERVEAGSIDVYRFTAESGQAKTIVLQPLDQLDGVIEVIGPSADRLPVVDVVASGESENLTLPIFTGGTYHVVVRAAGESMGNYSLRLQTSEVTELVADDNVPGELAMAREVDVFTFDPGENDVVSLELESSGSLDSVLDLIGPDGRRVALSNASGRGDAEVLTAVVTLGEGIYIVRVEGANDSFGTYTLRRSTSSAVEIDGGYESSGQLDEPGEIDHLTFTGEVGDAVTVTVTGDVDSVVRLIDPAARPIALADDNGTGEGEMITGIVSRAGIYIVEVSGFGDMTGDYQVSLNRSPSIAMDADTTIEGAIGSGDAVAVYTFPATAGDAVTLTVRGDTSLEPILSLVDPTGRLLSQQLSSSPGATLRTTEIVPETGMYIAQVSSRSGTDGEFEFDVATVPVDDLQVDRVGGLAATRQGTIMRSGEVDIFTLSGSTGDVVTLSVDPAPELNGAIEVLMPDGALLVAVDAEETGERENLTSLLPEGGTYIVRIQGFGETTGDYEVRLQRSSVSVMKPGTERRGTIESVEEIDVFEMVGTAGEVVTIDLDSNENFDGVLNILSPDGEKLATADARGEGGHESLAILYPVDGTYRALVGGEEGSVGTYTLALRAKTVAALEAGTAVSGTIDDNTDVVAYEFSGPADGVVSITLEPGEGFDGQLRVFDPSANQIAGIDNLRDRAATESITLKLPSGGTYVVFVSGFVSAGEYTLRFDEPDIEVIEYGDRVEGTISGPEDLDAYTFLGSEGDVPTIAVVADATLDVVVDVIDPSGGETQVVNAEGRGADEGFTLTLPEDRNYFLRIRGADGSAGGYTLRLIWP